MIDTVRVVESDFDLLVRLKRHAGIKNWNVLCRWAFCLSLADDSQPKTEPVGAWSTIEMTWRVFGGPHANLYSQLLVQRASEAASRGEEPNLEKLFYKHLHRGIGQLSNVAQKPTVADLLLLTG